MSELSENIYAASLPFDREEGDLIWFGYRNESMHYPKSDQPSEGWLCIHRHIWNVMGNPTAIITGISAVDYLSRDEKGTRYLIDCSPMFLEAKSS